MSEMEAEPMSTQVVDITDEVRMVDRTVRAEAAKLSVEDIHVVEVLGLKIQNLQLQRTLLQKDAEKAGEMVTKFQEDMKSVLNKYDVVVGRDQIAADGTITYNRG
jgi:hypothetical protein